jgi:nucleoside-diphosphate-sugar epimerase
MSSIAAVIPDLGDEDTTLTEADWNNWAEPMVTKMGKDTPSAVIYAASKTAAEKAFWKFKEEKKPGFTMTAINPT